jgi:hypothetical protein
MPWGEWWPTNDSNVLKMEELQCMMMSSLADFQLQGPNLWLSRWKNTVHGNYQLTVREVAEEVGISTGSCHTILMEDSGMHQVSAKFAPWLSTDDLKLQRYSICENLLQMSLPVMRCGFMVMTMKPHNNPHTGEALLCLVPRNHDRCTCKWNDAALCIMNSLLKVG